MTVLRQLPNPSGDVSTAWFDDEFAAVLFDGRSTEVIRLNPTASAVWALCDGATSSTQMAKEIAELQGKRARDVESLVADALDLFWDAGLLDGSPAPALPLKEAPQESRMLARPPDP